MLIMTNATVLAATTTTTTTTARTSAFTADRRVTRSAAPQVASGPELFWHDFCEACSTPHNHGQRWCVNCDWDG